MGDFKWVDCAQGRGVTNGVTLSSFSYLKFQKLLGFFLDIYVNIVIFVKFEWKTVLHPHSFI